MVASVLSHAVRRFPRAGINYYVPDCKYVAELSHNAPTAFSLGLPAASADTAVDSSVDSDATAGTEESQTWVSDSPYGRTLIVTPSADPGNSYAIDVYGYDWLGQPMIERYTGASGSTAILYGKKAFYSVYKTKIVTAATNAITSKVGTGVRLGLPFKGDVAWARENGVYVPVNKYSQWVWRDIAGAGVAGGPSGAWVYAQFPGYVKTLKSVGNMPAGSTNDPVITVELGGTAIVGLTTTVDTSAAATGSLGSDTPTTAGFSANNRFATGDLIEIVVADADASGAITVGMELVPTQALQGDITDPATAITGDPRGTYAPITVPASTEIIVGIVGDSIANSSGNGGLMGIQHYFA